MSDDRQQTHAHTYTMRARAPREDSSGERRLPGARIIRLLIITRRSVGREDVPAADNGGRRIDRRKWAIKQRGVVVGLRKWEGFIFSPSCIRDSRVGKVSILR